MADLQLIYQARFSATGIEKRRAVWVILCEYFFNQFVPKNAAVLDIACGYGEFINNVRAARKCAIDLNPDSPSRLDEGVEFHRVPATELDVFPANSFDVVFTSNFLEHLKDKSECDRVLQAVLGRLKPGGRFVILGPNIRYAYKEYWDYYDHYLPLSHLSLGEGLVMNGFEIERVIPRFLPYTMNNSTPTHPFFIKLYLALPLAWRILGKQFLVVGRKPLDK
jgi:SAM-dependent methyltransferase